MSFKASQDESAAHPIDIVEELVTSCEWNFSREGDAELLASLDNGIGTFELHFRWEQELEALFFACHIDFVVQPDLMTEVCQLLTGVNGNLWLGHFDLPQETNAPAFRHTIPMRHCASGVTEEQLEDLVATALYECEKLMPALLLLDSSDPNAREALALAMMDVSGEA